VLYHFAEGLKGRQQDLPALLITHLVLHVLIDDVLQDLVNVPMNLL
jgi:hypothetical protein